MSMRHIKLLAILSMCGLLSCKPAQEPAGALTYRQAQQAEQQHQPERARQLYWQAARLGFAAAAEPAVRNAVGVVPPHELKRWIDELAPTLPRAALYQRAGFWAEASPTLTAEHQQPALLAQGHCLLQIQPVLTDFRSQQQWQRLRQNYSGQPLAEEGICFLPPVLVDSRSLDCSEQPKQRLNCEYMQLAAQAEHSTAGVWLLLAGQGQANYNNGLLLAPVTADWSLLQHELLHAFGFLDEYPLAKGVAAEECRAGRLLPNLVFAEADQARWSTAWGIKAEQVQWTPVSTCQNIAQPAWRPVVDITSMQHYEYPLPMVYRQLLQRQLNQPQQLLPFQYLLAVEFKQAGRPQQYWQLLKQAAALGYAPAQQRVRTLLKQERSKSIAWEESSSTAGSPSTGSPSTGSPLQTDVGG